MDLLESFTLHIVNKRASAPTIISHIVKKWELWHLLLILYLCASGRCTRSKSFPRAWNQYTVWLPSSSISTISSAYKIELPTTTNNQSILCEYWSLEHRQKMIYVWCRWLCILTLIIANELIWRFKQLICHPLMGCEVHVFGVQRGSY